MVASKRFDVLAHERCYRGAHTLRSVLKDEGADKWIANERRKVVTREWTKIECYLEIPTTVDVLLRIDDREVSQAPCNVYSRNLKIVEMT